MSSTSRQTWVMWCCSSSVSTESFRSSVSCRCNKEAISQEKKKHHLLYIHFIDMQSLLPSSFESSGHVFLAPRWLPSSWLLCWSLYVCLLLLIRLSVPPENTANVCIFLTTTHSFCRTSSRSCLTFHRKVMSVSVLTAAYNICDYCRHTNDVSVFVLCLRWPRPYPQPDIRFKDYRATGLSCLEE